jgi:hypothetical protein
MPTITGHIQNGTIVLDTPLPPDWPEGTQVTLAKREVEDAEIDITGDSPEAIAAWIAWYEKIHERHQDDKSGQEMEAILNARRAELKAQTAASWARNERMFP